MAPAAALLCAVLAPAVAAATHGGAQCTSPRCGQGSSKESALLQKSAWHREAKLGATVAGESGGVSDPEGLHQLLAGCQERCGRRRPATRLLELARGLARSALQRHAEAGHGEELQVLNEVLHLLEDTIKPGMLKDHAGDQREIELHAEYVGECVEDFNVANVNITAGQALVQEQGDKMAECLSNKTAADKRQQMVCERANETEVTFDCGAPPEVPPYTMEAVLALQEWSVCAQRAAQTKWHACQAATMEQEALAEKCRDLAAVRNETICLVRQATMTACRAFTSCHVKSLYRYEMVKATVAEDEQGHKREALALARVTCFLRVLGNMSGLSGDEVQAELGKCDAIEEAAITADFDIKYPQVHQSSECAAKVIDRGGVQCDIEDRIDLSRVANCAFGSLVFLRGVSGKLLREAGGDVDLGASGGEPARWTLLNSTAGHVYLTSHDGQHLQDLNSEKVSLSFNVLEWELWSLEDAGSGKVRLRSNFGNYLMDGGDRPGLSSQRTTSAEWDVEHADGSGPACDADCAVSDWLPWGVCSATCGGGLRSRSRKVTAQRAHGGQQCPRLTETQGCNQEDCPVDCVVTDWSRWGSCSATCGGGQQSRIREVTTEAMRGGVDCPDDLAETRVCSEEKCEAFGDTQDRIVGTTSQ